MGKVYRKKFRGTNDRAVIFRRNFNLVSNFCPEVLRGIVAKSNIHLSDPSRREKDKLDEIDLREKIRRND